MKKWSLLVCLAMVSALPLTAEEWRSEVLIYALGAGMDGTVAMGPFSQSVDASSSEIVDNLDFAGMAAFRAENDRVAITGDINYVGISADGRHGGRVELDQWIGEIAGASKLSELFELIGGARMLNLQADIETTLPGGGDYEVGKTKGWVDFFAGARIRIPAGERWQFTGRADIGAGGSDLTWQATAMLQLKATNGVSLGVGYKILDIDYEQGSDLDYFKYDMQIKGPAVGIGFHF